MSNLLALLIIVGWLVCSIIAYSTLLAHAQREFKLIAKETAMADVMLSMFFSMFGPFGLVASLICTRGFRHGFMWWPK